MPSSDNQLVIAFDCDETLWINGNYAEGGKPNWNVVTLFHAMQRLGCYMIVWSAGGKQWAEEVSRECKINPDECRDKPPFDDVLAGKKFVDIAIDDSEDLGNLTLFIHKNESLVRRLPQAS